MKKVILTLMLCLPASASAEYLDVIEFRLKDDCSFGEYMQIANDFNTQWGANNGYSSRVAMPLQNDNLKSLFWVGTAENAEAFGRAWDTWRDALADPESVPSKLWERFQACSENIERSGYDLY
jgi:hypothetical protein